MKPRCAGTLFAALLLVGLLTSGFRCYALPPRQHAAHGVIESIDHAKQTLVLVDPKTRTSRIFVWNDSTRFRQDGKKISPEALQAGIGVKGYYRKEIGRLVLRELRWSNTAPHSSAAATQHDSGSAFARSEQFQKTVRGSRRTGVVKDVTDSASLNRAQLENKLRHEKQRPIFNRPQHNQ